MKICEINSSSDIDSLSSRNQGIGISMGELRLSSVRIDLSLLGSFSSVKQPEEPLLTHLAVRPLM